MSAGLYSYSQPIMATAVPYGEDKPVALPAATALPAVPASEFNSDSDIYGLDTAGPWVQDDAIERSSNIFNQLDSMIAAVHSESNALDSMRDKLKELDGMKKQISNLTKRLLEADQANITCKGNLIRLQEECTSVKKIKNDLEIQNNQLKLELNRTKDAYGKERQGRMAAQQDIISYKDHISRLEKTNHDLQYEVKNIAVHLETNELLKADLQKVRSQYQNDKQLMQQHIKQLEAQLIASNTEGLKNEMRGMASRLMDLVNNHSSNNNRNSMSMSIGRGIPAAAGAGSGGNYHHHQQQQHQHGNSPSSGSNNRLHSLNMNSVGLNNVNNNNGLMTNSTNNSYYGGAGGGGYDCQYQQQGSADFFEDTNDNDVSSILYDGNAGNGNAGVGNGNTFPANRGNTSLLLDDDDSYYANLMQQTQMAAQLDATMQQKRQQQQAQQQQQQTKKKSQQQKSGGGGGGTGKKSAVASVVPTPTESESEFEEDDDEDNDEKREKQEQKQEQKQEEEEEEVTEEEPQPRPRRKSKQKRAGSGSSVSSQGSKAGKGKSNVLPKI